MVPKVKIEIVCATDVADRVVEAIQASAATGAIGDGKIFILDVGRAVRIRTGETDDNALQKQGGSNDAWLENLEGRRLRCGALHRAARLGAGRRAHGRQGRYSRDDDRKDRTSTRLN